MSMGKIKLIKIAEDIIGYSNTAELLDSVSDMAIDNQLSDLAMFGGAVMALHFVKEKGLLNSKDISDIADHLYYGDNPSYWEDMTNNDKESLIKSAL